MDMHDGLLPEAWGHKRLKTFLVEGALVLQVVLHVFLDSLVVSERKVGLTSFVYFRTM